MKTVAQMIDDILLREGGYTDHPADKGGPTNYGITLKTLQDWHGTTVNPTTAKDVKDMSVDTARWIYAQNYYLGPRINLLTPALRPFVFDCSVNHGPKQAIKFVQEVVNQLSPNTPLAVDGVCGPATATRAHEVEVRDEITLMRALVERRRQFYLDIIKRDPSQEIFRKGWMNRLAEFTVDEAPIGDGTTTLDMWRIRALKAEGEVGLMLRRFDELAVAITNLRRGVSYDPDYPKAGGAGAGQ